MSLTIERIKQIRPLQDRVLVQRATNNEDTTPGGIVIPDQAKERAQIGKIIAVGPGKRDSAGALIPMSIVANDTVFFGKYAGTEIGEDFIILREDEIIGKL